MSGSNFVVIFSCSLDGAHDQYSDLRPFVGPEGKLDVPGLAGSGLMADPEILGLVVALNGSKVPDPTARGIEIRESDNTVSVAFCGFGRKGRMPTLTPRLAFAVSCLAPVYAEMADHTGPTTGARKLSESLPVTVLSNDEASLLAECSSALAEFAGRNGWGESPADSGPKRGPNAV